MILDYEARPSVGAFMLRSLVPGALRKPPPFPPLRARWKGAWPGTRLGQFLRLTDLGAERGLPLLYLQSFTFPLQMVILTHPSCPFPIWRLLQVRNRLVQHRVIPASAAVDAEAAIDAQRILEKGLELDIRVSVTMGGELAWEGLTTHFYGGHFGEPGPREPNAVSPPEGNVEVARWQTDHGGGLRFGGVTGDYNGLHLWSAYARLFGFRRAFHHPHAVIGQCLARLPDQPNMPQRLDLWLKGPVYYDSDVVLTTTGEGDGAAFALTVRGSSRPALQGRWASASAVPRHS